jgi:hypothetical protein
MSSGGFESILLMADALCAVSRRKKLEFLTINFQFLLTTKNIEKETATNT